VEKRLGTSARTSRSSALDRFPQKSFGGWSFTAAGGFGSARSKSSASMATRASPMLADAKGDCREEPQAL